MSRNNIYFYQKGFIEIVEGEGMPKFPYHTHDSFLVGVVKSGEAHFVIDNRNYILKRGMSYIVPANIGISITPLTTYSYLTICLKGEIEKQLRHYEIGTHTFFSIGDRLEQLCERFKLQGTEEEFINILIEILELNPESTNKRRQNTSDIVMEAIKYIQEHLNDKFTLQDLCKSIHISKYHLIRRFKMEMGITPKQYDQQCKIRQVKERILSEELMVDVAMNMDFAAQSHLCSMFKRYMGITMNDYKKNFHKATFYR